MGGHLKFTCEAPNWTAPNGTTVNRTLTVKMETVTLTGKVDRM